MTYPEPGQHFPAPGIQQPAPSSPPKRTAVVVLTIVAVLMLGAAVTFGALWFLEQDDHKQTTEQLADEKQAHDETKSQLSAAEKAKTDAESKVTAMTPCADAGKELARLVLADASEAEGTQAGAQLVLACGK